MQKVVEGGRAFSIMDGVFYNSHMELCRDICSAAVGSLEGKKLSAVDAMCACGVRGIRYLKENRNVLSVALVDQSRRAAECAKKNALLNKCGKSCKVKQEDACRFLQENEFDIVELDPFGSPVPFLYDAIRSWREKKEACLSVTATDMAVLCGANRPACLKYYGATPLNNEFTHENAIRILAAKVVLAAAPFNFAATPIFSFSHRHYVKVMFAMRRNAPEAVKAVKSLGFVSYCYHCCWRGTGKTAIVGSCPCCGNKVEWGGPMLLGKLWDEKLLERMLAENVKRSYRLKKEIEKVLSTMLAESKIDAHGYYDLHVLARKMKIPIRSMDEALERIRRAGFAAARTHFCPTAVRTNAPHEAFCGLMK